MRILGSRSHRGATVQEILPALRRKHLPIRRPDNAPKTLIFQATTAKLCTPALMTAKGK
jgi:hypothetical protein